MKLSEHSSLIRYIGGMLAVTFRALKEVSHRLAQLGFLPADLLRVQHSMLDSAGGTINTFTQL